MFARSISIRLKPNTVAEFTRLIEKESLPRLRKQKGFQDEITFVVPGGAESVGISLWDKKENAEAYSRDAYPGVLRALGKVVEGTPPVRTYEVCNSTFHKIAAQVGPKADTSFVGGGQSSLSLLLGQKESTSKMKTMEVMV